MQLNMQAGGQSKTAFHLDNYQWHYRALLIFTPKSDYPAFQTQLAELESQKDGLCDRDLKLVSLVQNGKSYAEQTIISEPIAEQIRFQFAVEPEEFAVILVGKDGTQKHRYSHPILIEELLATIDAMPMRQYEMQHGNRPSTRMTVC